MKRGLEQLGRLLYLLPRLADGNERQLSELAGTLGTEVEQLVNDLRMLVDRADLPGGFVEGVAVYLEPDRVSVTTPHFHRPMRLTRADLAAIELGLAVMRNSGPPEDAASAERALERLRDAMTHLPDDGLHDGVRHAELGAGGDMHHLAVLRRALYGKVAVELGYRSSGAAVTEQRRVHPFGLVYSNGAWYLVAHCESGNGHRIFRLDRMESVVLTNAGYTIPETFSLHDFMGTHGVFNGSQSDTMVVRYSSRVARWIAERRAVEPDADGSLTIEHPLADIGWAVRHVLQYGPDAEVLEPEEVRTAVRQALDGLAGA